MTVSVMPDVSRQGVVTLLRDLVMLAKPRIVILLLITCACALLVASKGNTDLLHIDIIALTLLGLALSASGANMVNMWFDRDIDILMTRTQNRPIPAGRMQPGTVLTLGVALGVLSFIFLWFSVNFLTAAMSLSGYLFYVFIYTMLLKRRTVQNIVIGGAAGSFPPLVGWAAVQNEVVSFIPWAMFAIIFLWTPPHFWALALKANKDYTRAKVPMLPVVKGVRETKIQILYYLLLLLPVTLLLAAVPPFGLIYLLIAAVLGGIWLYKAVKLLYAEGIDLAMDNFKFSLVYLALLFIAMVVDTFI